ncbi:hypothetical protein HNQ03_002394 [Chryseobacterium sp. 16F]|uniref:Uncharacterized protein n=1 Tax=Frigoriflavimonas asaccharolytica TaxID=2735899 RepID=A0A8J8GCP7_9FLAO|nr:hypothetical protein [Frigoriflavimonas asaccharolytica]
MSVDFLEMLLISLPFLYLFILIFTIYKLVKADISDANKTLLICLTIALPFLGILSSFIYLNIKKKSLV